MGLKRAYDEEGLQELSFKHPKQLDSCELPTSLPEINNSYGASPKRNSLSEINPSIGPSEKTTSLPEINPCEAFQKPDIPGDAVGDFCDSLCKDDSSYADAASKFNGTPVSYGTSGNREDDIESRTVSYSCVYPESYEFTFPRRNFIQFEDTYSALLNSSPTKEVPIGLDHQADVPVWDSTVTKKHSIDFINGNVNYTGRFVIGSCVIPMPELDLLNDMGKATDRKLDCNCLDGDSVRCVQQHVKEAREKLKENIGLEKFVGLGFLEMGEEVAYKWTEEEEQLFHEVVYSNPVSHGRNFWVHLSTMFTSRSKEELVSYYFNVFMLRRRAAQNRSRWLETDSDDDEWKGSGGSLMTGEDERSAAISFINQNVRVDHGDDSQHEYDNDDDDSSSDDDDAAADDDDNGDENDIDNDDNGDLHVGMVGATENMVRESHSRNDEYSDDHRFNHMPHHLAKSLGSLKALLDVEENSCTSFEIQPCVNGSHHPIYERGALQETKVNGTCEKISDVNDNGPADKFGCQDSLDSCDSKAWDITYPVGFMTSVDLLPTCNMMEEIFGPCNWNKSNNDKWLP